MLRFKDQIIYRIKHGLFLNWLYARWKREKLQWKLFYLVQEGTSGREINVRAKLEPLATRLLDSADFRYLAARKERDYAEEDMLKMMAEGCRCLGILHRGEILAYTWYNPNGCDSAFLSFPMEEDEAYLYGARTFEKYKGMGLAPYLRNEVYQHLAARGIRRCYSITVFSNIPSILFKRKLGARNLKLCLQIRLFKKFRKTWVLRRYRS
jgi:ribosomal protein S18 acetylase RimI-like enzyme